jgi:hypothetical protein
MVRLDPATTISYCHLVTQSSSPEFRQNAYLQETPFRTPHGNIRIVLVAKHTVTGLNVAR